MNLFNRLKNVFSNRRLSAQLNCHTLSKVDVSKDTIPFDGEAQDVQKHSETVNKNVKSRIL